MEFLHLSNYRDKTYRYVVFTCLLSMILIGDILSPFLNYYVLALPKDSPLFNNYVFIANIAPSLPFMLSFIISLGVTGVPYKTVVITCFGLSTLAALFLLGLGTQNFLLLVVFIVVISFSFRALYFSLDRQLSTILLTKIKDFQSDTFILGGLLGSLSFKFSAYIYSNYKFTGNILIFLFGSIFLCYFAAQIPTVSQLEATQQKIKHKLKLAMLFKTLVSHPALIKFMVVMLVIMLLGGSFNILLMTKIHHEQIGLAYYSNLISISMALGIVSALLCKTRLLNRFHPYIIMSISIIISGLSILGLGLSQRVALFAVFYLIQSLLNNIIIIHMMSHFFQKIGREAELILIAPLLNGIIASLFYCMSLLGQLLVNYLLGHHVSYQVIYYILGIGNLGLAGFIIYLIRIRKYYARA